MMPPPLLSTSTTTTSITKRSNGAGGSSLAVSMKNRARKEALASHTRIRSLAIKFGHNSLSPPRSVGSPLSGTTVASFASNSNSVVSSRRSSLSFARAVTPSTTGGGATFDDALTLLSKIDFFRASQPTKSGLTRASTHNVASSSATLPSSSSAGSTVVPPSPNSRLRANKLGVMEVWKFNPERFRERSASITSEPGIVLTMIGTEGAGDNSVTAGAVHSAAAAAAAAAAADLDNSVANKLESIDSAPEPVKLASNDGICIIEKGSESLNEATVQETINNKQILSSTDGLMITTAERSPTIVDRKSQDVSSSAITSVVSAQQPRGSAVDSALSYISVLEVESTLVILMRLTHPHALLLQKSSVADPISTSILECTGFIVEFLEFAKVSASASSLSSTSSRSPSPSPRPHKLLFRSPAVEHRMCLIQLTGRSNPMFLSQAKSMLLDYTEQIASPPLPQSPRSPRSPSTAIISSPLSSPVRPRIVPNDRRDDADSGVRLYSPANAPEWAVQSHTTEMAPVIVTVDQSEMDRVFGREAAHEMMQTHRSP
ncbi:hypothetical protein GQ42DRAFT_156590 [Ramicandelaber brevisporus]|nr:hypothetical protein GQ42DRAFT_156590 [Ramicandelaber brevisporus]